MRYRSTSVMALAGSLILTAVSLGPIMAQGKGGGDDQPVTLQLVIADTQGRQSEPAAVFLTRRVSELSDGSITIVPTFGAGLEQGVATLVESGTADLALSGTRAWDLAGVTSLQGLQAPFLIDNDALALAVAKSDIAARALSGMGHGVTGLTIWPEDLRHLFAFPAGGRVFDTPTAVSGATILVIPSAASRSVLTALGGVLYDETQGDRVRDAESGVLQGMEAGLWGAGLPRRDGIVAGDVVLFPKYQGLVANDGSLARLSDHQREVLRQAVAEMQADAFTRQFTEAELAARRCADGGTVIQAGPEAVAAFVAATQPARDAMEQDPFTKQVIADITTLKAATPASPGAGTCVPVVAAASPSFPVSDTTGHVATTPPNGTYRVDLTLDGLVARGMARDSAARNAGTWTWTWTDGQWHAVHERTSERCSGSYASEGDAFIRFVTLDPVDLGCGMDSDVVWKLDGDQMSLIFLGSPYATTTHGWADERAFYEQVWTRVGDAP
jgi:TRAP-type C4-dicarboxylate transport system substrate-binding protein